MNLTSFWQTCAEFLLAYPQRPATLRGDSVPKQLINRLQQQAINWLTSTIPSPHWKLDASIGIGNWAAIPWLAVFDTRETSSAQQGTYPVIHFSAETPIGIRIGWGVSVTEFGNRSDARATEIFRELLDEEHRQLSESNFVVVVPNNRQAERESRVEISGSKLAERYAKGMLVERFISLEELQNIDESLDTALRTLLITYRAWVDRTRQSETANESSLFPALMGLYASEKIVFQSPRRDARYLIGEVDQTGCSVLRLDADRPDRVTWTAYQQWRDWLRDQGGVAKREELDSTVAKHMCYLQAPDLCLRADRRSAKYLGDAQTAGQEFIQLILAMQTITAYKPTILALVIEAVRDGELTQNHVEFDWLLDRFIARLREQGQEVGEQQLAEGFARMSSDFFWLLAYRNPKEPLSTDKPTPNQIRQRVSHARLHEAFWLAIQHESVRQQILDALQQKWWPDMNQTNNVKETASDDMELAQAMEVLLEDVADQDFIFQPWQVATYVTALRTKPFVILAGVSGTGKSKLPSLVSQLTGGLSTRISVRPDWTDSSDLIGYVDLQGEFRPGVFLKTAAEANRSPQQYFVSLIDEMNLARVEHYFAEVLSTIEDRQPALKGGFESPPLFARNSGSELGEWAMQRIPANLGIVGTVNMDESSHGFSRKVLDRAFTIELSEVDLSLVSATPSNKPRRNPQSWPIRFWHCRASRLYEADRSSSVFIQNAERAINLLQQINDCLVRSQLQVGYRTRDEVILFLINASEMTDSFRTREGSRVDPLDVAIMMKILPRLVGGSNAIRATIKGLLGLSTQGRPFTGEDEAEGVLSVWETARRPDSMADAKLPRTAARLCLMWERLLSEGYTSFWL